MPETRYARSGEVHIAYQVVGDGTLDLVWIPSVAHHVELSWENPIAAGWLARLATLARMMIFDKRGTGMSDRVSSGSTLETRMEDIRAVMDAAASDRAVVCALGDGGPLAMLFAATYPDRTAGLVLMNSLPRFVRSAEFPHLQTRAQREERIDALVRGWGEPDAQATFIRLSNPDMTEADARAFGRVVRLSVSPGAFRDYMRMNLDVDVCGVLASIRVPTLVIDRTDVPGPARGEGRYLAAHIPGARLVELPGRNFAPIIGDVEALQSELRRFLGDVASGEWAPAGEDRVLATVLFTDIIGSTARAAELGDKAWGELLVQHHSLVRRELARHRGREMDTAGDGFFATFDGPARAIHCASAIVDAVQELGLDVRAGLHTGECELVDRKVGGIAVHIGARIAARAAPGEVLLSSTVRDLVAGSGLRFVERDYTVLEGVPGEWQLYAVSTEATVE